MTTWHHIAVVAGFALGLAFAVRLIQQRQRPSVTLAWLLAILVLPYVAVPLYILISGRKIRARMKGKPPPLGGKESVGAPRSGIAAMLAAEGAAPLRHGNALELLTSGEVSFARLFAMMGSARRSIHVSMFLLAHDEVGDRLVELLARQARQGVTVRLLVDTLGSLRTHGRYLDPIREAGGHVGVFMPVTPLHRPWSANLRNHRKLAIVDGEVAWTGGMNLALDYMGPDPLPSRWVDASVLVRGGAVADLEAVFRADWAFATGEQVGDVPAPVGDVGSEAVQVLASGPDVQADTLSDVILASANECRRRVWIVTPYFVPDEPLMRALLIQARMGRDVLLVLPRRSNHRLADLARTRFLFDLVAAGGRVALLPDRMLHAKLLVFDDRALFGSANVDLRSLYLNFELSLLLEPGAAVRDLASWVEQIERSCVALEEGRPSFATRTLADLSSLVAPLL